MLKTAVPPKFPIPFGQNAQAPYIRPIPEQSQIGINNGYASLNDGFPPLCATPIAAGGVPPFMQDMNGLLKQITQWCQFQGGGGVPLYDANFATQTGGYASGAILQSTTQANKYWYCMVDNNTNDPDAGGAGWLSFDPTGAASTGDVKFRPTSEDIVGWVKANALTIGNAASGATSLASPTARALFRWHWMNFPNTQCPVLPGGHGANPDADFDANKTIQVLDWKGTGFMGMDTMGGGVTTRLNGVPVVFGNATTPGSVIGENLHTLVTPELSVHDHGGSTGLKQPTATSVVTNGIRGGTGPAAGAELGDDNVFPVGNNNIVVTTTVENHDHVIADDGGNVAHNTVDRVMIGSVYLKL